MTEALETTPNDPAPNPAPDIPAQNVAQAAPAAPAETPPAQPAPTQDPTSPASAAVLDAFNEDIAIEGVKYGGQDVNVTIPADLANFANENGFDAKELANELYASEDFTLSEATMGKLYDKFPKWQVDSYLSGIKAKNDSLISNHKTESAAREQAEKEAWDKTMEVMGGEDRWSDLEAFASSSLEASQVEDFNSVMQNGSPYMQQLAIKDLWGKFVEAGSPAAPASTGLEEGDSSGAPSSNGQAVTAKEYLEAFTNGEYSKDPKGWDARRKAGLAKGI